MNNWMIDIDNLSILLNKPIKKNVISVGVDLASNVTGLCIMQSIKGNVIKLSEGVINVSELSKGDMRYIKMDTFLDKTTEFFKGLRETYPDDEIIVVVEDCYFSGKVESFQRLCEYHALFYSVARHYASKLFFIPPTECRNLLGFVKYSDKNKKLDTLKDHIRFFLFSKFNLSFDGKHCEDIADASGLSLVGLIDDNSVGAAKVKHKNKSKQKRKVLNSAYKKLIKKPRKVKKPIDKPKKKC